MHVVFSFTNLLRTVAWRVALIRSRSSTAHMYVVIPVQGIPCHPDYINGCIPRFIFRHHNRVKRELPRPMIRLLPDKPILAVLALILISSLFTLYAMNVPAVFSSEEMDFSGDGPFAHMGTVKVSATLTVLRGSINLSLSVSLPNLTRGRISRGIEVRNEAWRCGVTQLFNHFSYRISQRSF